jgi:phosphohistidine phosphatase SixA
MTNYRFSLLRHGESVYRFSSSGSKQTHVFASIWKLTSPEFDLIVRSPLHRASQSTGIISNYHFKNIGYAQFPCNSASSKAAVLSLHSQFAHTQSKGRKS